MILIIAERSPADRQAHDITDPLLTTIPAALERGRVELDGYSLQTPTTVECAYQSAARCGMLVKLLDAALGATVIGKITGVEHTAVVGGAVTRLEILVSD